MMKPSSEVLDMFLFREGSDRPRPILQNFKIGPSTQFEAKIPFRSIRSMLFSIATQILLIYQVGSIQK